MTISDRSSALFSGFRALYERSAPVQSERSPDVPDEDCHADLEVGSGQSDRSDEQASLVSLLIDMA